MNENLKDILSNLNPDIDQETLLLYLQGKLTPQQQHEVEKQMMDNDFDADALEGLQDFNDKRKINALVEQLNRDLKKKTEKKKKSRKRKELVIDPWVIIAIVLILALAALAYFIINQKMQGR
jgi:chromatin segregation and condensation protein Rec8/ScpA/Scc1 (kleisin family)